MRFAVVGLGSMGKRRVRDLLALGHEVDGFDVRADRCEAAAQRFGIGVRADFETLVADAPNAVVVCTPPDQHVVYYEQCFERGLPFFSEANILVPSARWFARAEESAGVRGHPSQTWRFHPLIGLLRERVAAIGTAHLNTVSHQYGGYLPDWHPWEHYGEFYAGRRATSAAREMVPFEMEALTWVFGPVRAVCGLRERASRWETDMDDTYLLLVEFASGLRGCCSVELHQRAPFRSLRVSADEESLVLDLVAHTLQRFDPAAACFERLGGDAGAGEAAPFDLECVYRAEIAAFVDALGGVAYAKTWEDERHLSNILVAAEESAARRAWVSVAEAETLYEGMSLA